MPAPRPPQTVSEMKYMEAEGGFETYKSITTEYHNMLEVTAAGYSGSDRGHGSDTSTMAHVEGLSADAGGFQLLRDDAGQLPTVGELFKQDTVVYLGYVDDPRNTDHAWMETTAYHFHCPDEFGGMLPLASGDDAAAVMWLNVDAGEQKYAKLYADHKVWVDRVQENLKNRPPPQPQNPPPPLSHQGSGSGGGGGGGVKVKRTSVSADI